MPPVVDMKAAGALAVRQAEPLPSYPASLSGGRG